MRFCDWFWFLMFVVGVLVGAGVMYVSMLVYSCGG